MLFEQKQKLAQPEGRKKSDSAYQGNRRSFVKIKLNFSKAKEKK